jgi:hypothetical protein
MRIRGFSAGIVHQTFIAAQENFHFAALLNRQAASKHSLVSHVAAVPYHLPSHKNSPAGLFAPAGILGILQFHYRFRLSSTKLFKSYCAEKRRSGQYCTVGIYRPYTLISTR